jgi:hypothetical protein
MRHFAWMIVALFASAAAGQEKEQRTETLVDWMRSINTLQVEFNMVNHHFAAGDELRAFAREGKRDGSAVMVAKELSASSMAPYTLQITTSADGLHYQATIRRPSDMHEQATSCKTAVFSDDSGLVYLGQNIGCSGADRLGASGKPTS